MMKHTPENARAGARLAVIGCCFILCLFLFMLAASNTSQSSNTLNLMISSPAGFSGNWTRVDAELYRLLSSAAALSPQGLEKTVAIAEVNSGFFQMAWNLYRQLQIVTPPMNNIVWVGLDANVTAKMKLAFVNATVFYDPDDGFAGQATSFRTPEYNRIVKHKWVLLHRVLRMGFNVLVMDVDFAVLRNPFLYIQTQPVCDFTFYDQTLPNVQNQTYWVKRSGRLRSVEINTGFMLFKPTGPVCSLVSDFLNSPMDPPGFDDQHYFNRFMRDRVWSKMQPQGLQLPASTSSTQCTDWQGLSVRLLPSTLFGSWRHHYEFKLADWTQETPYVLHYNWLVGYDRKKHKMAEHGYWLVGVP